MRGLSNPRVRACRVCGCTDDACAQCVAKTGGPCFWVDTDLCSACDDAPLPDVVVNGHALTGITTIALTMAVRLFYIELEVIEAGGTSSHPVADRGTKAQAFYLKHTRELLDVMNGEPAPITTRCSWCGITLRESDLDAIRGHMQGCNKNPLVAEHAQLKVDHELAMTELAEARNEIVRLHRRAHSPGGGA